MIIWLIGISGAGKTTIGRRLEEHFNVIGKKCYRLEGEEVRGFFDEDLGHSNADREVSLKRIILGAYLLDKSDVIGIICVIGHLEHLRQLARRKIAGYNEIWLKKDIQVSIKNDVQGMYKANMGKTPIVGIDVPFEEPLSPDLVLDVDQMTEEETYKAVIDYIADKYGEEYR